MADFRRSKNAILTMEALNDFDFWITFALEMSKVFKNPKFRGVQLVRIDSFGASKCPKLISRKI